MKKQPPSHSPLSTPLPDTLSGTSSLLTEQDIQKYLQAATSDSTRKAYKSAVRQFEKWGGRLPTDSHSLVSYLLSRAEHLNPRTLDLHLTAIGQWHQYQGIPNPVGEPLVQKTMRGIRRTHGKPKQKAKALSLEHIAALTRQLHSQPESKKKVRDLAIILAGFFGAFRRSELVAIQVEDLIWEEEGLIIRLPRSKTDQSGEGLIRALPYGAPEICPARTLKNWLKVSGITTGPVFRSVNRWDTVQARQLNSSAINDLLKNLGNACGFEFVAELSSHSFRRGLSTSAAREKVGFELIKKQGGWKSDATVWEYIEEGQQFTDNASAILMKKMAELLS
ncbi:tyrosine-type recombinase/integrase [Microbulbifer sp. OS29]|uniref:Tyrosine-type recombinase/integrase n=1 Tax=Microbulbifer okhotskensis TaxID=2926617 RepID=A0A9X2ENT8_9GAMM|nr:site-specific integrase [Microbulbifer okhotskensis]MCO1335064.1 tyrosine-type recombinase/integrase [Microbulbifer okhotskensis]